MKQFKNRVIQYLLEHGENLEDSDNCKNMYKDFINNKNDLEYVMRELRDAGVINFCTAEGRIWSIIIESRLKLEDMLNN